MMRNRLNTRYEKSRATSQARRVKAPRTPNLYPLEKDEMKALKPYLDLRFGELGWEHVPNENLFLSLLQKTMAHAILGLLQAMGMKRGSHDIRIYKQIIDRSFSLDPRDYFFYSGVSLEMKRQKGGNLSPSQKKFRDAMVSNGWKVIIAYGAQDAINKIEQIYGPYRP